MMLEQSSDVLRVVLSACTHPPIPPVWVAIHEVRCELNAVRHRVYKICKRNERIYGISNTAYYLLSLKLRYMRLIGWVVSFNYPKPIVLYTFSLKTLNL